MRRDVERRFVGTDRVDLERDHSAGQLVAEIECLDRPAPVELVQSAADAVDRATERVPQPPGVALMVAVCEQHMLRDTALVEPRQPLRRNHRVDQHTLGKQEV